jgi:hypothetical protein
MVPMLTLSWLWHSVEREKTLAGMLFFSASAVQAETAICTAFNPWFTVLRAATAPDRFAGRPLLNFVSTSSAIWRSIKSARLATQFFIESMTKAICPP